MKERIKTLRKYVGLNQTEFGKRIGVKQTTVAGYETGTKKPRDAVIRLMCNEFNVNKSWIEDGNEPMFQKMSEAEEAEELVKKLLNHEESEVYMLIREIMRTYERLDGSYKTALEQFCGKLLDNMNEARRRRDDPGSDSADVILESIDKIEKKVK